MRIKKLFEDLDLHDVDGGREDFTIGGPSHETQVDVIGGKYNTLIVVEAKSARQKNLVKNS